PFELPNGNFRVESLELELIPTPLNQLCGNMAPLALIKLAGLDLRCIPGSPVNRDEVLKKRASLSQALKTNASIVDVSIQSFDIEDCRVLAKPKHGAKRT